MRNIIYSVLALLIGSANITAQVTIGSDQPPRAGAGLDLRSSDRGLLLPNVALSNPATDFQLKGGEGATATGMVIYNTSNNLDGPGVYVWNGSRWILITCVPETPGTIDLSPAAVNLNSTFTASVPEATGPAAPTAYVWALPTGLTGTSTTRSITITGAAGTYNAGTIKVTATNACGTSAEQTSAMAVTVRDCSAAPATPTLTVTARTINRTGTTTLSCANVNNGATTYAWTLPTGLTGSSTTNTITVTGSTAGTYAANTIKVTATNACGKTTATGSGGAITVRDCSATPTVSLPASDETKITKQGVALPAALSVTADGKGATPTYRWQSSANLSTWANIGSATAAAYTAPVANAGTTHYRCVVTTGCGSATSKVFTVNVCGTAIEDDDGNWYCTGDFGDAGTWMTTNLRTKSDLTENGAPGTNTSNKYYWYPGQNSSVNAATADDILDAHPEYGLLYTWAAASGRTEVNSESNGVGIGATPGTTDYQGICPTGWHLPNDYEWNQLEEVIAKDAANVYSTTGATTWNSSYSTDTGYRGAHGEKMKSRTAVSSSYATGGTSNGLAANGFDALLVGYISSGSPGSYGTGALFWSSSSYSSAIAWRRLLDYGSTGVARYNYGKYYMVSVRCKKDCSAAPATPTLSVTATTINRTGTATLSCTDVSNGATSYEWTLPSGLTGSSTTNTIVITGATAGTYNANSISVKATNDCGSSTTATGSGGAITVRDCTGVPATPTLSVTATTINRTGTTTLECTDVGNGATTYAWTLPSGLTGSSTTSTIVITGATAGTYNANSISVKATNDCGSSTTAPGSGGAITVRDCSATPTISSPASDQTPANQVVDATYAMTVTANIYSASSVTYQWQSSTTGTDNWSNVSIGGNSNAYNAPTATANLGTAYYRCTVTTACGEAVSKKWKITVDCVPTISSPSADETRITKQGTALPAALSVTANVYGASAVTFQWQSSANLSDWANVGSATNAAYTAPVANAGTTYYRCVVTTGCGSATSKVFTVIVCGTAIQDDEGNWYCTGDFGTAGTWMTMNLRRKSSVPENINSDGANSAYYYYPDKNPDILTSHPEYGLLYTWAAANIGTSATEGSDAFSGTVSTRQGICPADWHLPSDYEWYQLEQVIAESAQGVYSTTEAITWDVLATDAGYRGTHAPKMKSTTPVNGYATGGTSNSRTANGFDTLLVGYMSSGSPYYDGMITNFWSSSSYNSYGAWHRYLYYNNTAVFRGNNHKYHMLSVRCKKN